MTALPFLAYAPFVNPLPLWDVWALLLVPLCAAVSVVYKCIKCQHVRQVPREATVITLWIIAAMIGVAAGVLIVYRLFVG